MVGERYRDLIEAADTIHHMRGCTHAVIQSVAAMTQAAAALKLAPGLGRPRAGHSGGGVRQVTANTAHLAAAASIKLLTALPEQIWAAVEAGSWAAAAELYLVAQHVHTGLAADQGAGVTHDKVAAWFPVISRQWAVLQQLHTSLVAGCRTQLAAEQLTAEPAVDCQVALLLLCGITPHQTFATLLECRTASLRATVSAARNTSAVAGVAAVAHCVRAGLDTAACSVARVCAALSAVAGRDTATVARIPASVLGATARYLPGPVLQFRPRISPDTLAQAGQVAAAGLVADWVEAALAITRVELRSLLQIVESVEGLKRVREAVLEVVGEEPLAWLGGVSLWEAMFSEVITDRMMEIVTGQLEAVMDTAAGEVEDMMAEDAEDSLDFVWTDTAADLGAVWGKGRAEKMGLRMKCWGWAARVQEVWRALDSQLTRLLDSVAAHPDIVARSTAVTCSCVARLLTRVAACDTARPRHVPRTRVLQSFLPLTPTLARLLGDQTAAVEQSITEHQQQLLAAWLSDQLDSVTLALSAQLTPGLALQCLPAWDQVSIAETGDSGEAVTSTISVPASPSLPLVSALLQLSTALHRHHPASLPASLLSSANTRSLDTLVTTYTSLSQQTLTQNFALQLLFDISFVQTLLVSRDSKDQYQPRLRTITASLEANIDPFDLSVFSPHLEERVKTSCARQMAGLACLVPADRAGLVAGYRSGHGDTHNHNILAAASATCSRFQLLPLAPATSRAKTVLAPSSIVLDTVATSKSPKFDSKSVQQTAANFFGSMSWFGNN